jgi:hypothetical protein
LANYIRRHDPHDQRLDTGHTDQSAFYGGETAADHTKGWGSILDKLAAAPGPA